MSDINTEDEGMNILDTLPQIVKGRLSILCQQQQNNDFWEYDIVGLLWQHKNYTRDSKNLTNKNIVITMTQKHI